MLGFCCCFVLGMSVDRVLSVCFVFVFCFFVQDDVGLNILRCGADILGTNLSVQDGAADYIAPEA